jgi:aspartate/methionine/tyrosine aminotransferase
LGVRLMQEMGVAMTPGMSMYMGHAGFFRMVFSAASPTAWPIALERLEVFAVAERARQ